MKKLNVVSKEDWIILRLMVAALKQSHNASTDVDFRRTLDYIVKKYSSRIINAACAAIHAERQPSKEER